MTLPAFTAAVVFFLFSLGTVLPVRADFSAAERAYRDGDFAVALDEYKADGSPEALYNVGLMYYNGEGATQDKLEAARWLGKAAEKGNINAQYSLGAMYEEGDGVEKNPGEAIKWYRLAADQGSDEAQESIDRIYRVTEGRLA